MKTATPPPSSERVRFTDLVAAEWIKIRSLRSTHGVPLLGTVITLGICVNSARSNAELIERGSAPLQRTAIDPPHAAFVPDAYQILALIAGSIGALALTGEYGSGLLRTTLWAVPDRRAVVAGGGCGDRGRRRPARECVTPAPVRTAARAEGAGAAGAYRYGRSDHG